VGELNKILHLQVNILYDGLQRPSQFFKAFANDRHLGYLTTLFKL